MPFRWFLVQFANRVGKFVSRLSKISHANTRFVPRLPKLVTALGAATSARDWTTLVVLNTGHLSNQNVGTGCNWRAVRNFED